MECLRQWRNWIRPLVMGLYGLLLCVALPLIIADFQLTGTRSHFQAWFIGGMFVLMAVPISLWGILQHLTHYTQPHLQRCIIRILWMVPIYAINSWLAMRFKDAAIYLDTARECYEAYVIYNFMSFLLNYLYSNYPNLEVVLVDKPQVKHLIPICCFPPWPMGKKMILNCKHGVLQYTLIRPLMTILALLMESVKLYDEGTFSFKSAWTYIVIINNISQIWAMYCLVLFYKVTREELAPIKPFWKFLCVKAVVFMSFWQGLLVAILARYDVIKGDDALGFDQSDVATGMQDFCICIEMFVAAVAHHYAFSHRPYIDYAAEQRNCCDSFLSMWDVSDVRADVVEHVRRVGNTATGIVRPLRSARTENERTPLLQNHEDSGDDGGSLMSPATNTLTSPVANQADISDIEAQNNSLDITDDISTDGESLYQKSLTASMNNYIHFEDSTDCPERTSPQKDQLDEEPSVSHKDDT